jgi:coenzyme F420-0:L-glutamate ligase/coenzyme F420-1:gamma-L-glutamate ligase
MIEIIGLEGMPLIKEGDNLGEIIVGAAGKSGVDIRDGDVIVITQKIISRAEGRLIDLGRVTPSPFALKIARDTNKDPRHVEVVLRETGRVVRMRGGIMIMETRHGFVCANAGVDLSNIEGGMVCLLPLNPDLSADGIRREVYRLTGREVAVVITDTWGRPWRLGQVDFAIGVSGMSPFMDYRGEVDRFGYELRVTNIAVADELASAAELAKGKLKQIPIVVIRGYDYPEGEGSGREMVRPPENDLFR